MTGSESIPAFPRSWPYAPLDGLLSARETELADVKPGWARCAAATPSSDRLDLVHGLVPVAADVEVDERGVPVLRDRAAVDVLHRPASFETRATTSSIAAVKARIADPCGAALDQDVLARRAA